MQEIAGSNDTTVIHYLVTLKSDEEIKMYISHVLGSGPAVQQFAHEFVEYRHFAFDHNNPSGKGIANRKNKQASTGSGGV